MRKTSALRLCHSVPLALCVVEQFDAPHSARMVLFKIGMLLFNLVPSIALRLVGCEVARPYSVSQRLSGNKTFTRQDLSHMHGRAQTDSLDNRFPAILLETYKGLIY